MKHVVLDCYGADQHQLDDMKIIDKVLTDLSYQLNLNPICPTRLVPYYYGRVKEDIGISAFVLLEGGHITIHTFPIRECYFVDVFTVNDFDTKKLQKYFHQKLVFDESVSFIKETDRKKIGSTILPYNPQCDFGPHLMAEIEANKKFTMEDMYDFLEIMVDEINMDPITRATVLKSNVFNPKFLSGIIVIAQSHIALHYEYSTQKIYADIFSCSPFEYDVVASYLEKLGNILGVELMARGTKHIYKVKSCQSNEDLLASTKWQHIIRKNS